MAPTSSLTTSMSTNVSAALQLKNEGNLLFGQQNYDAALQKYTEALVLDPNSAVLFSNRAACNLNMGRYLDASGDANEATKLDPTFTKAWARMARSHDVSSDPNILLNH